MKKKKLPPEHEDEVIEHFIASLTDAQIKAAVDTELGSGSPSYVLRKGIKWERSESDNAAFRDALRKAAQ